MANRVPDELVLLCESCGYDIESLPRDGACPECGRTIVESLPIKRVGSRWQRKPGPLSLLTTWRTTLSTPRATFSTLDVSPHGSKSLAWTSFASASGILFGGVWLTLLALLALGRDGDLALIAAANSAIILFIVVFAMWTLALLTLIEERGIRFWGPRRGWRITPTIAKVICAHASVGWVLGSVLAVVGHIAGWGLLELTNRFNVGVFRGPMQLAPITLPILGLIAGMLTFEILVYIGMGRMKYANRERSADGTYSEPRA